MYSSSGIPLGPVTKKNPAAPVDFPGSTFEKDPRSVTGVRTFAYDDSPVSPPDRTIGTDGIVRNTPSEISFGTAVV